MIELESGKIIFGCSKSIIPNDGSVKIIGECSFDNVDKLRSIIIPDGVTTIEDYAFCSCDELKYVIIPKSVNVIERYAFINSNHVMIIGEASSEAEAFAKRNNIDFGIIGVDDVGIDLTTEVPTVEIVENDSQAFDDNITSDVENNSQALDNNNITSDEISDDVDSPNIIDVKNNQPNLSKDSYIVYISIAVVILLVVIGVTIVLIAKKKNQLK